LLVVGAVGRETLEVGEEGIPGLVLGRSPVVTTPLFSIYFRENWAPLAPLVLLVLSGSLVRQVLEEKWASQALVESG
jgi:hypothetical protein